MGVVKFVKKLTIIAQVIYALLFIDCFISKESVAPICWI